MLEVTALEWRNARAFLARLQTEQEGRKERIEAQKVAESSTSATKRQASERNGVNGAEAYVGDVSPRRSKRVRTEVLKPAGSRSSPLTIDDDDDEDFIHATDDEHDAAPSGKAARDDDDVDLDYVQGAASSRSSPSKQRRNQSRDETPTRDTNRELKADDLVQCPICSHRFTVTALNRHLDSANCYPGFPEPSPEDRGLASKPAKPTSAWFTKGSTSAPADAMANEKRLVRPQYNLRSDRELRKLLDDAGLPTTGDREKMIERHRQWVNIWNANLDSTKARRSAAQLRKDLAAWERTRASAKDHSAHVDKQKATWVKSNKEQFDDLIAKAKMGVVRDRKLRDAPKEEAALEESASSSPLANGVEASSEGDAHVISSSPAVAEVSHAETAHVES